MIGERSLGIRISTRRWGMTGDREWRITVFWGVREWNWYFGSI